MANSDVRECSKCHLSQPLTGFRIRRFSGGRQRINSSCKRCELGYKREQQLKKPALRQRRDRTWRAAHPDRVRVYGRRWVLKNKFGMTLEDYDRLFEAQGGVCAICKSPHSGHRKVRDLIIEHDHTTGRVRGLTCQFCNHGLAGFKDNIDNLKAAILYLEKHHATC